VVRPLLPLNQEGVHNLTNNNNSNTMPIKVPPLGQVEIRERVRRAITVNGSTYIYCYEDDKAACPYCGAVSYC
jgi:hypothetical protein